MFLADGEAAFQEVFHLYVFPVSRVTASASTRTGRPVPAPCLTNKPGTSGKGCLLLASLVPAGSDSREKCSQGRPRKRNASSFDLRRGRLGVQIPAG